MPMFYVYHLVDPRCGSVFYVGKGTGRRVSAHEQDAKRGKPGRKCDRIREIVAVGLEVQKVIVKRFDDELAAYDYERRQIARIGLAGLTNETPCGGGVREDKHRPPMSAEQVGATVCGVYARFTRRLIGGYKPLRFQGAIFNALCKKIEVFVAKCGEDRYLYEMAKVGLVTPIVFAK